MPTTLAVSHRSSRHGAGEDRQRHQGGPILAVGATSHVPASVTINPDHQEDSS
jgi:hypothetical protein